MAKYDGEALKETIVRILEAMPSDVIDDLWPDDTFTLDEIAIEIIDKARQL